MKDAVITFALVGAFALLVTVHLWISVALARRHHVAQGLAALVAVPLAPWLASRNGMKILAVTWIASAAAYGALLLTAAR